MMRLSLILLFLLLPFSARADALPFTYEPEPCEFQIGLPGEPTIKNTCEGKKCYDEVNYTQVFDLASTIKVRLICNKINEDIYNTYSGRIMEKTLKAMTDPAIVQTFETSFRKTEDYKQAGLVGEGLVGSTPTLYIGQLWIGKKSALSVEAQLIGAEYEPADGLFSEILGSIGYKKEKAPKPAQTQEP